MIRSDARTRLRAVALYAGGLLGPLGAGVVSPMLPELSGSFHVDVAAAGASLTAYFVPFAVLQLISGTIGERFGRRRSVLLAYGGYLVASLLCALAPTIGIFLAARALQGVANAFTSPLLIAGLADTVPAKRLSRSIGLYGACQAAGLSLAPLVGAAANTVSWRWAFVGVAVVSAILALAPPPGAPRPGASAPSYRPLFTVRMTVLSLVALASYLGGNGVTFLVALYAERRLAAPDPLVGLVLVGFGLAGMGLATTWGSFCDRFGAAQAIVLGMLVGGVLVACLALTPNVGTLVVFWIAAGAVISLVNVGTQNLAAREVPDNRGGAVSVVSAFRFSGAAIAPLLWLPLYPATAGVGQPQGGWAFGGAGIVLLVGAAGAGLLIRRRSAGDHG
jgi:MFS family permease